MKGAPHCFHRIVWTLMVLLAGYAVITAVPACAAAADGGADCSDWNTDRFFEAASVEEVTACLKAGANPEARDEQRRTPLHLAAEFSTDPAVIVALRKAGADPEARIGQLGVTPLHVAATSNSNPAIIAALVKVGADPNARYSFVGYTSLHLAVMFRSLSGLSTAAARTSAGANLPFDVGLTPSHRTDDKATFAIIAALAEAGVDPNAGMRIAGLTPLHWAAGFTADPATITALLEAGADPNSPTQDLQTPLHSAAEKNANPAIMARLLEVGADPNAQDERGKTPLHVAAEFTANPAIVAALLEAGADPQVPDKRGRLAWELAVSNERLRGTDVYRWLKEGRWSEE